MITPNTPHTPPPYYHDDEISLVDLAKILIKRWKIMLVVFVVVVLGATAYAWMSRPTVGEPRIAYTTLLSVGYKTPTVLIEPLGAVATQLRDAFIPAARQTLGTSLTANVDFDAQNNNIVRLITTVSDNDLAEQVRALHQQALSKIVERHGNILDALANQSQATVSTAVSPNEARLLVPTEITSLAQPTQLPSEPAGMSTKLFLALSLVLGGMLAFMAAFISHFVGLVSASLREE